VTYITLCGAPWHRQMGMEDVNMKELVEVRGNAARRNVAKVFSMMSECSRDAEIGLARALGPGAPRPEGETERNEL
jgi:hypothetical protein